MMNTLKKILDKQEKINSGLSIGSDLPKYSIYAVSELAGNSGKTKITNEIGKIADNTIVIDCYMEGYITRIYNGQKGTLYSDSERLIMFPENLFTALYECKDDEVATENILYSLRSDIQKEMAENKVNRCIIDTPTFFAGGTQLSWYASDALIVPMKVSKQSITFFELMIRLLTEKNGEFRKFSDNIVPPKIQMIPIIGSPFDSWSQLTADGKSFMLKLLDICRRNIDIFSTDKLENHFMFLDSPNHPMFDNQIRYLKNCLFG